MKTFIQSRKLPCLWSYVILFFSSIFSGNGQSPIPQLDTLNQINDKEEKIRYILRVEEDFPFIVRDSLVKEAIGYAEELNNDSILYHVLNSAIYIDYIIDKYDEAKAKMDRAYAITLKMGREDYIVSIMNNMANYFQRTGNFEKADSMYKICTKYWVSVDSINDLSTVYNNRAIVFFRKSQYAKADSMIQIAKEYGKNAGPRILTRALNTELIIASYSGQNQKAFEISNEVLKVLEPVKEKYMAFFADCLSNNGTLASALSQNRLAIHRFLKADSIYQVIGNKKAQISTLESLASIYDDLGDYSLAINYSKRGVKLNKSDKNPVSTADAYKRLAIIQTNSRDSTLYASSKALLDSAFQIYNEKDIQKGIGQCYYTLGNIYTDEDKLDSANYYLNKSIEILEKENLVYLVNPVYKCQAEVLERQGKYQEAFQNIQKVAEDNIETEEEFVSYNFLKGKILSKLGSYAQANTILIDAFEEYEEFVAKTQAAEIKEIADKYQAEKQLAINEKLQADQVVKEMTISRQRNAITYGGIGLALFSLLSYLLFLQSQKRKKLNSELEAQKNQILLLNQELNHRVKNNLAFMTTLLEMQGRRSENEETRQALQESESRLKALSIVHANLFKSKSDTKINLKDYIQEILGHLQEIFGLGEKRLIINAHLADMIFDAEDAMRVGLILNELVTNSVKHAFAQVDDPRIDVETIQEGDKVLLRYKDNGPGISEKTISEDPRDQSLGIKLIGLLEKQVSETLTLQIG